MPPALRLKQEAAALFFKLVLLAGHWGYIKFNFLIIQFTIHYLIINFKMDILSDIFALQINK